MGPYAGYIQQYLFHQARTGKLKIPQGNYKTQRTQKTSSPQLTSVP